MNQCFGCNTCQSADKPMEAFIRTLPMETSHHRVESQETKCNFGLQGVCCRLCANGPCRITPDAPRGICGASADVIVVRNFLRAVSAGAACYLHVVENTALNLKHTAMENGKLKGLKSLNRMCEMFGIDGENDHEKALKIANLVLSDLYKPDYEEPELVKKWRMRQDISVGRSLVSFRAAVNRTFVAAQ